MRSVFGRLFRLRRITAAQGSLVDFLLQEEIERGSHRCDGCRLTNFRPGGRNSRAQNVSAQLELQRQRRPTPEPEADFLLGFVRCISLGGCRMLKQEERVVRVAASITATAITRPAMPSVPVASQMVKVLIASRGTRLSRLVAESDDEQARRTDCVKNEHCKRVHAHAKDVPLGPEDQPSQVNACQEDREASEVYVGVMRLR